MKKKKKKKKLKGKKAAQSLSCYKHPTKDMVETQIMQGEPGLWGPFFCEPHPEDNYKPLTRR